MANTNPSAEVISKRLQDSTANAAGAIGDKGISPQMKDLMSVLEKAGRRALLDKLIKLRNLRTRLNSDKTSLDQIIEAVVDRSAAFGTAGISEDAYHRVMSSIRFNSIQNYMGAMGFLYPTFKIYFIEDDGEFIYFSNDMYAYSAVKSIDVFEDIDTPTITLQLVLSNMYGNLTNIFADQMNLENPFSAAPNDADSLSSTMIKPGCKIQVRMGYSSLLGPDDIVFNGEVASITGDQEIKIVATSYSTTLNKKIGEGPGKDLGGVWTAVVNMTPLQQVGGLREGIFNYNTSKIQNLILQLIKEAGGLGRLGGTKISLVDLVQPLNSSPLLLTEIPERFKAGLEKSIKSIHGGNYLDTMMLNVNITDKIGVDDNWMGLGQGWSEFAAGKDRFSGSWLIQGETVWDSLSDLMLQEVGYNVLIRNLDVGNTMVIDDMNTGFYMYSTKNGPGILKYGPLIRLLRRSLFSKKQTYRTFRTLMQILQKDPRLAGKDPKAAPGGANLVLNAIMNRLFVAQKQIAAGTSPGGVEAYLDNNVRDSLLAELGNPMMNIKQTAINSFLTFDEERQQVVMICASDNVVRQRIQKLAEEDKIKLDPKDSSGKSIPMSDDIRDTNEELAMKAIYEQPDNLPYFQMMDGLHYGGGHDEPVIKRRPTNKVIKDADVKDTDPEKQRQNELTKALANPVNGAMGFKVAEYFIRAFLKELMIKSGCYRPISVTHYKDSTDHIIRNTIHTVLGPNRVVMNMVDPGTPIDALTGVAVAMLPSFLGKLFGGAGFSVAGLNNANNRTSVDVTVSPQIRQDAIRVYETFQKNGAAREAYLTGGRSRYLVANNILANVIRNWYDGQLVILGDQRIRSGDKVVIYDQIMDMYGTIVVRQVHHSMDLKQGFITTIMPRMMVNASYDLSNIGNGLQGVINTALAVFDVAGLFMAGGAVRKGATAINKALFSKNTIGKVIDQAVTKGAKISADEGTRAGLAAISAMRTSIQTVSGTAANSNKIFGVLRNPSMMKELDDVVTVAVKKAEDVTGDVAGGKVGAFFNELERVYPPGSHGEKHEIFKLLFGERSKPLFDPEHLTFLDKNHKIFEDLGISVGKGISFKPLHNLGNSVDDMARGLKVESFDELISKLSAASTDNASIVSLAKAVEKGFEARARDKVDSVLGTPLTNFLSAAKSSYKLIPVVGWRTITGANIKNLLVKSSFGILTLGIYSRLEAFFNPVAGVVMDVGDFFGQSPLTMYPMLLKGQPMVDNMQGVTKLGLSRNGGMQLLPRISNKVKQVMESVKESMEAIEDISTQYKRLLKQQSDTIVGLGVTTDSIEWNAGRGVRVFKQDSLRAVQMILVQTEYGFFNTSIHNNKTLEYLKTIYEKDLSRLEQPLLVEGKVVCGADGLVEMMKIVGKSKAYGNLPPFFEFGFSIMPDFFRYSESVASEMNLRETTLLNSTYIYFKNLSNEQKITLWTEVYTRVLNDRANWALSPRMLIALQRMAAQGIKTHIVFPAQIGLCNDPGIISQEATLLTAVLEEAGLDPLSGMFATGRGVVPTNFKFKKVMGFGTTNEFLAYVMNEPEFERNNEQILPWRNLWSTTLGTTEINQYPYVRIRAPYAAVPYMTNIQGGINSQVKIEGGTKISVASQRYQVKGFINKPVADTMSTYGRSAQQNYNLPIATVQTDWIQFPEGVDPAIYDPWSSEYNNLWFIPSDDEKARVLGDRNAAVAFRINPFLVEPMCDVTSATENYFDRVFRNPDSNAKVRIKIPSKELMLTGTMAPLESVNALIDYTSDGGITWTSLNEELVKKFYTNIAYSGRNQQILNDPTKAPSMRALKFFYTSLKFENLAQAGTEWKVPLVRVAQGTKPSWAGGGSWPSITAEQDLFAWAYQLDATLPGEPTIYNPMDSFIEIIKDGDTVVMSPKVDPLPSYGQTYKTFRLMGINAMETTSNQYLSHEGRLLNAYLLGLLNHNQIAEISSVDINIYEYDSQYPEHTAHPLSTSYAVRMVIDANHPNNQNLPDFKNGYVIYKTRANLGATSATKSTVTITQPTASEDFEVYGRILRFVELPYKVNLYKIKAGPGTVASRTTTIAQNLTNLSRIMLYAGLATPYLKSNIITHALNAEFSQFHLLNGAGVGIYSPHATLRNMLLAINNYNQPATQAVLTSLMKDETNYYNGHIVATQSSK